MNTNENNAKDKDLAKHDIKEEFNTKDYIILTAMGTVLILSIVASSLLFATMILQAWLYVFNALGLF